MDPYLPLQRRSTIHLLLPTTTTRYGYSFPYTYDSTRQRRTSNQEEGHGDWRRRTMGKGNILHVVTTQFQQLQPNLLELGRARLRLFETFCLPTMIRQNATDVDFSWFVMTDHISTQSYWTNWCCCFDGTPTFPL